MRGARVGAGGADRDDDARPHGRGGIYDHVGGGFARYSTDASWHVPHFEKMLYDNAQLARLYTRAWQVTRGDRYRRGDGDDRIPAPRDATRRRRVLLVAGRRQRGRRGEVLRVGMGRVGRARRTGGGGVLGATPNGNWEGTNVLWRPRAIADVAAEQGLPADELAAEVEDARRMLFEVREGRVHPATDDKVLAAWNALAIGALAEAGRVFDGGRTSVRPCAARSSS